MGRRLRPNVPGGFFHITARLQGRARLFTPALRTGAVELLAEEAATSDVVVVAHCIMPNHLHLVLRQGRGRLHQFMQPLLRRIAARVQRTHLCEGHVFERAYHDSHCMDAEYLRNAIVYTHLNPVRAALCGGCGDYEWSSHRAYIGLECSIPKLPKCDLALPLFGAAAHDHMQALRAAYAAYVAWRQYVDAVKAAAEQGVRLPPYRPRPCTFAGDCYWRDRFAADSGGPDESSCNTDSSAPGRRADLRDLARAVLLDAGADEEMLPLVRSRYGSGNVVALRRAVICRAALHNYRGVDIAQFLRVSPSAVSRTLRAAATAAAV